MAAYRRPDRRRPGARDLRYLGHASLGLFASGQFNSSGPLGPDNASPLTGLLYGGGLQVLAAQAIGSLIITSATFVVSLVLMYAVNAMGYLRVSEEGEFMGLDLHEHGVPAYPEYALHASATPHSARSFNDAVLGAQGVPVLKERLSDS